MNSDAITNYLFEAHVDYINPKIIARRQVYRLVDKVLVKVAPTLALGDKGVNSVSATSLNSGVQILQTDDNKENTGKHSQTSEPKSTKYSEKNTEATLQMQLPGSSSLPSTSNSKVLMKSSKDASLEGDLLMNKRGKIEVAPDSERSGNGSSIQGSDLQQNSQHMDGVPGQSPSSSAAGSALKALNHLNVNL